MHLSGNTLITRTDIAKTSGCTVSKGSLVSVLQLGEVCQLGFRKVCQRLCWQLVSTDLLPSAKCILTKTVALEGNLETNVQACSQAISKAVVWPDKKPETGGPDST